MIESSVSKTTGVFFVLFVAALICAVLIPGFEVAGIFICVGIIWVGFAAICDQATRHDEERARIAQEKFDRWYASASDEDKIDHHLARAQRYGTNYDANIAQALIERNKK